MQILITNKAFLQMRYYVEALDYEISGIGRAVYHPKEDTWIVEEIKIFKQEVSKAEATLDGENILEFMTEMLQKGQKLDDWCLWWHSHNDMGVFWSGTDTGTMDENPFSSSHMLSIVTNNAGEYRARYDIYKPAHLFLDNIPVKPLFEENEELKTEIEAEVKEKVTEKQTKVLAQSWKGYDWKKDDYYPDERFFTSYNDPGQLFLTTNDLLLNLTKEKDLKNLIKNVTPEEKEDLLDLEAAELEGYSASMLREALKKASGKLQKEVLKNAIEFRLEVEKLENTNPLTDEENDYLRK